MTPTPAELQLALADLEDICDALEDVATELLQLGQRTGQKTAHQRAVARLAELRQRRASIPLP